MRHLLVVLTGIMITFGCSALCFSTWGLFQPVVAEGLGVEVTAFAAMIWAWLGSSFGFTVEFIVALAMLVVILLLGLYIFKAAAGYKKDWTTE